MILNKKALSPIITTVLLIVIALVLASIIFMWARGFGGEQVSKFGESIEQICSEVAVAGSISGGKVVSVINQGATPIYKLRFLITSGGSSDKEDIEVNLAGGGSTSVTLTNDATGKEVEMIPVLLGSIVNGEDKTEEYPCSAVAQILSE